ncbi:hypothetical protein SCUP234_04348 [Seiridium cupressi]
MVLLRFRRAKGTGVSGWKRAARVNSIVLGAITLTLVACLITSAKQTAGLSKALMFYTGTCDGGSAAQVNVALHLLLNVVSTAIFASSNFFMQVLNSPSRKEVDEIHANGSWMGIGVPSVRNAFRVSKFKTSCWILLLVSSIPLHLLFNSIIFQTDQRSSDFQLAIASEGFVNAASFYPPGASLTPSGFLATSLWGADVDLLQYNDSTSIAYRNISAIAREGNSWKTMSVQDCYNEYCACEGLRSHRSVIVVAEQTHEWVRDELWNYDSRYQYESGTVCDNTCSGALDRQGSLSSTGHATYPKKSDGDPWTIDFFNVALDYVNHTYHDHYSDLNYNNLTYGLIPGGSNLTVSYCLAEPVDRVCQVGLSTTLLLAVTLCVFVKKPQPSLLRSSWAVVARHRSAVRDRGLSGQFLESDANSFISDISWTFASAVLLANSPQLLLSFCYLAYVLGIPLTEPAPSQSRNISPSLEMTSLELVSTSGHQAQGADSKRKDWSYFETFQQGASDTSLPEGTAVSVGYSVYALLGMLIVSVVLICIPIGLACQKLPAGSVSVGSNSIAISAACHVSPLSKVANRARSSSRDRETSSSSSSSSSFTSEHIPSRLEVAPPPYSPVGNIAEPSDSDFRARDNHRLYAPYSAGDGDTVEMVDFISSTSQTSLRGSSKLLQPTREGIYEQLARSRIRWGVVEMPSDFYREFENHGRPYEHLSFGVLEDHVAAPVYMRHYA